MLEGKIMKHSTGEPARKLNGENFVVKVISPAICGQTCPICLRELEDRTAAVLTTCIHAYCVGCIRKWSNLKRTCPLCNAQFDSWFCKINLSSRSFRKERLPNLNCADNLKIGIGSSRTDARRILQSTRNELSRDRRSERPLTWRRSFGRRGPESVPTDVIAWRKLQWRASIYDRRIQAVPSSVRSCLVMNLTGSHGVKEAILERIKPWIQRELEAILGDPDPTIIVHLVTSLFVARLEAPSSQLNAENDFLSPLRPFLYEKTDLFWHELRCFAGSSLRMEEYDSVVEYRTMD
ncbi:E3 ubiquitin-protein ligase Topors isoform X1 [Cucurbita maxima]|uniref:RING-type E3 ubiquitin transferase n=1 Tax=Cucurbita maxima TaxID=3661 RepID=A0A6J1KEK6_CUCMA|nr:E3 ubiquitin-protein ligase Topors isoform X1 [Cucurbita maxima]